MAGLQHLRLLQYHHNLWVERNLRYFIDVIKPPFTSSLCFFSISSKPISFHFLSSHKFPLIPMNFLLSRYVFLAFLYLILANIYIYIFVLPFWHFNFVNVVPEFCFFWNLKEIYTTPIIVILHVINLFSLYYFQIKET